MQFRAKKSLGQNFLKSKEALRAIVKAGEISDTDIVLEVGPGKGVLTELLLPLCKKVVVIEKDYRLIPLLKEKFATELAAGKLEIIESDILDFEISYLKKYGPTYKLIANIPYYITGALLRTFLTSEFQPSLMVLLLQKEVAERIVVRDGKESILSISVKAYGIPTYIQTVKAKYFSPAPKVDSAVIQINSISKKIFDTLSEDDFFGLVKAGFAHKRKKALSNIAELFRDKQKLEIIFEELGIQKNARPEELEISSWIKLAEKLVG